MKKISLIFSIITVLLLLFSSKGFSQTANLGVLTTFEAYTAAGAIANTGGTITGDVGSNFGAIGGTGDYTGGTYNGDDVTDQSRFDLLRLYILLNDKFVDYPSTHDAVFANETLTPGVYSIGGAGSLAGDLVLHGDSSDFFIIKMNGAMTVGAGTTVSLTGGVEAANVFWLINGAVSVAADADVKGTLFSKAGAVGLGANANLEGRMFSMGGAITLAAGSAAGLPTGTLSIPVFCESDCTPNEDVDVLGVLSEFALFSSAGGVGNTGISGINGLIGGNAGAITSYAGGIHIGGEESQNALTGEGAIALQAAYEALMLLPATAEHSPNFLDNDTITPGVYDIPGAGSLGGTVFIDAAGDSTAIFVLRFAGAFNIEASSKMILTNGARRCNMFWIGGAGIVSGAVNIGASSEIKGNFIAHGGACNSGAGVFMAGRQLSTFGAVNTNNAVIYMNPECITSTPRCVTAPEDQTENIESCDASEEGTVITTETNENGCEYQLTTITTWIGASAQTENVDSCVESEEGEVVTTEINDDGCEYELTTITTWIGTSAQTENVDSCVESEEGEVVTTEINDDGCEYQLTTITTWIGQLDETINETSCNQAEEGSETVTMTNDNGCDYDVTTITTYIGESGITEYVDSCVESEEGEVVTTEINDDGCEYELTTITTWIGTSDQIVNNESCYVSEQGIVVTIETNVNGCDYYVTTVTNWVGTVDQIVNVESCVESEAGTVVTTELNANNCPYELTTVTTWIGTSDQTVNVESCVESELGTVVTTEINANGCVYEVTTITTWIGTSDQTVNVESCVESELGTVVTTEMNANGCEYELTTVTSCSAQPDFTPTIDIEALNFIEGGDAKDFVVNITENNGAPSSGPVVVNISIPPGFTISYDANATISNLLIPVALNNGDWFVTAQGAMFMTLELQIGATIQANSISSIGFTIDRNNGVAPQQSVPLNVAIVNGSGSDSADYNNSYNVNVTAQ